MAIDEQSRQKPQTEGPGSKSFHGSASTDTNKSRLQTVEGNQLDEEERTEDKNAGEPLHKKPVYDDDDIFDTGYMRSAAFPKPRPGQRK